MAASKPTLLFRGFGVVVGVLVLAFVGGAVVGYLRASGVAIDVGKATFWVLAPIGVVLMAGAIWLGALWMRSIDEAAREAHKAAWYWGGSSGMAVGGFLMILASLPTSRAVTIPSWFPGRTDPASYAATGAFSLMLLMIIGYGIVWAWWWLARR